MYHEELESLAKFCPKWNAHPLLDDLRRCLYQAPEVLQNVGMTRIDPVMYNGQEIVPLQFLKAVLPEPSTPGPDHQGQDQHRRHRHRHRSMDR
jgi:saccharopine dehydrogenase (NAD+, L-lysine-forming)